MKPDDRNNSYISLYKRKGYGVQEAYDRIKNLIAVNQLVPGQKLISTDISKKVNMGVTPIIQALNRLEASGLLRYEPNKGYFVGEVTESEVRQLYQAREALEVYIIPNVIKNIDSEKLNEIRRSFKIKDGEKLSRREMILDDTQFHLSLARYSHNDVIYKLLEGIFEQAYLKYRPEHLEDQRVIVIKKEHNTLLKFLEIKDARKATVLLRNHIRSGMEYVIKTIKIEKPSF